MDGEVLEGVTAPATSPVLWYLFGRYTRHYICRSFHAVRL